MADRLHLAFRWLETMAGRQRVFLAGSPDGLVRHAVVALGRLMPLSGYSRLVLQSLAVESSLSVGAMMSWRELPPFAWPLDLSRAEELLVSRSEELWTLAVQRHQPPVDLVDGRNGAGTE